jgi:hypothetical protein
MAELPIRASDAERDAAAERLRKAAGEGRLEPDELEERLGVALRARTRDEIARLVVDLPGRRREPRPQISRAAAFVAGNGALVALWMADVGARDPLLVGDSDFFWPIVPIVLTGVAIVRKRRPRLTV